VSDEEGFLNRWSRRKQDAAREIAQPEAAKMEEAAATEPQTADGKPEEEFDISTLPPIESITAGTDIRAFLSKGVPAALTQAALRRAWSADPAIRDYIGLSEYSWDFNAPGEYGFGPLDPSLNVQEMVADVFGKVKKAAAEADALAEKIEPGVSETEVAAPESAAPKSVELRGESNEPDSERDSGLADSGVSDTKAAAGDKMAQAAAAPQQHESEAGPVDVPVRRHGSALPN